MKYQKSVLNGKQKAIYWLLVMFWVIAVGYQFYWWFTADVIVTNNLWGFVVNTLILAWIFIFPGWFYFNAGRMVEPKIVDHETPFARGRIAMVVTKAPSEPWTIVQQTLEGMLGQKHFQPYDVWLADECPNQEAIEWCKANGVQISSRFGIEEYHNSQFPRRTKSKEGNLAYFYDMYGYQYDFVVQFDADHKPEPDYLYHIMVAFADPKVGYVACPSICDANTSESWLVRARLWAEAGMHGALQAGYSAVGMPFCIGSHYAVRTAALKGLKHPINLRKGLLGMFLPKYSIHLGGVGPELAEDHTTSLSLVANGWRGVFSLNSIAHGDGASSFAASMQQEFQWSRSLTQVLLSWTKGYFDLGNMTKGQKAHFLLGQLWYVFFSVTMLIGNILPIVAVMTDSRLVKVDYLEFLLRTIPVIIFALLPLLYLKSLRLLRPSDYDLVSLESLVFAYIRWPWALWGVVNGVIGSVLGIQLPFKVTNKGGGEVKAFPITVLVPYFVLAVVNAVTSIAFQPQEAGGYLYFTMLNALTYSLVILVSILWHIKDNWSLGRSQATKSAALPFVGWVFTNSLVLFALIVKFPESVRIILGI